MDGTFRTAPYPYQQIITIHGEINGYYFWRVRSGDVTFTLTKPCGGTFNNWVSLGHTAKIPWLNV